MEIVLVDRHVGARVERVAELREQIVIEPLAAGGVGIVENVVGDELELRTLAPGDRQVGASHEDVLVGDGLADGVIGARRLSRLGDDFAVTAALQVPERHADIDVILNHRRGERELQVVLAVVAARHGRGKRRRTVDVARHVFERSGNGVLAVQGALRAAQHLEPRDVENVQQRRLRACQVDVVDVNPHAGIESPQRVALAHAADVHVDRAAGRPVLGNLHVRNEAVQILDIRDVLGLDGGGSDGRDGERDVLQVLRPAPRRDDDLLQPAVVGGRRGRCRIRVRRGRCRNEAKRNQRYKNSANHDGASPSFPMRRISYVRIQRSCNYISTIVETQQRFRARRPAPATGVRPRPRGPPSPPDRAARAPGRAVG